MNIDFSQLKPISSLPRKYNQYVQEAKKKGAVIFMKKNKPETVLVNFKTWEKLQNELEKVKLKLEEQIVLSDIAESEEDIKQGRFSTAKSLKDLCK